MARFGWRTTASIIDWLKTEPFKFEFFQAVRILEKTQAKTPGVGSNSAPDSEPVYFSSNISHNFPASENTEVILGADIKGDIKTHFSSDKNNLKSKMGRVNQPRLTVNILGLSGNQNPLPTPVTEEIINRIKKRDYALKDFLDIFNNRLVALIFKAKRLHHSSLSNSEPWSTPIGKYLRSISGLSTSGFENRLDIKDRSLLKYSSLFSLSSRSAHGLERLLTDFLGTDVVVRQFRGGWIYFDDNQTTKLGPGGQNYSLGVNTVLGTRLWDQKSSIEIEVGPLKLDQFRLLLPGGALFKKVRSLASFYLRDRYKMRLRLILLNSEIPTSDLNNARENLLGQTSWLVTQKTNYNDKQVVFEIDSSIKH